MSTTIKLNEEGLINIKDVDSSIKLDIRYASSDNITGKVLYSKPLCFLKEEVAEKLSLVQKQLKKEDLTLVIWDGYRPLRIQKFIWEAFPNPKYNAKISNHNKGIAVDLTLGDKDGNLLLMPTDLDVFSEKSHHGYDNLPEEVIRNRNKLKSVMEKNGFESFEFEWWHYSYPRLFNAKVLDIPI